ncbi:MAG: hypothetical protein GXO24_03470 [Chlorobi bacterium]|nr:hypothetical protein [Chlorobiota bacterium]
MKRFILIILFGLFLSGTTSCKKEKCPSPPEPTVFDYLTMDAWQYQCMATERDGQAIGVTGFSGWERVFTPSGDYYLYNNNGNTVDYGNYEFDSGVNPMTLSVYSRGSSTPVIYTIRTLTKDSLVYYNEEQQGGHTYRYTYFHIRQKEEND